MCNSYQSNVFLKYPHIAYMYLTNYSSEHLNCYGYIYAATYKWGELLLCQVREICEVIASGIQPLQNLTVLIYVGEEKKKEWAQHWINRGLRGMNKQIYDYW